MNKIYDVIVCGAGTSGMIAAIAAARNNASVLLVEKYGFLGGTNTAAMVWPLMTFHHNRTQTTGGIANEIIERLQASRGSLGHLQDPIGFCSTITPIDVESLKALYFDYCDEETIDLLLHTFIIDVIKDGSIIKGIKVANKSGTTELFAKVVIDATGDADVCKLARCPYVLGRDDDHLSQPMTMMFTMKQVNLNKVKDYMKDHPEEFMQDTTYTGDYLAVSGFFSKVKLAKERNDYTLNRDRVLFFQGMKEDEVSVNMTRVSGLNGTNAWELSIAERLARKQVKDVIRFLKTYIPGFEDAYLLTTPAQIGVRETRHIEGRYVLTKDDILQGRTFDDAIAIGAFPIDIHAPVGSNLELLNLDGHKKYQIPLRTLLPINIEGLLVTGRAFSATHEANASARVSPTAMSLGQAAGTLAALAVKKNITPHQVDVKLLQDTLRRQGQIIDID